MSESAAAVARAPRRSLWIASIIEVIVLLVFVGIMALVNRLVPAGGLQGVALVGVGLLMAVVPAVVWLAFFYQQDVLDPEPKQFVGTVFLLSALIAAAIAIPLVDNVLRVQDWLYANTVVHLLGSILVVGILQEYAKFLAVRFSVYKRAEFNERTDGIIYATAAGLGFATALNLNYVLSNGGVDLGIGALRIVETTLAHASFAGVLGYFIGQARFERTPAFYLPAGLLLAAALNGIFFFLLDQVSSAGLVYMPLNGLIFATLVAIATLGVVFWLIRRANRETLSLQATPPAAQ